MIEDKLFNWQKYILFILTLKLKICIIQLSKNIPDIKGRRFISQILIDTKLPNFFFS